MRVQQPWSAVCLLLAVTAVRSMTVIRANDNTCASIDCWAGPPQQLIPGDLEQCSAGVYCRCDASGVAWRQQCSNLLLLISRSFNPDQQECEVLFNCKKWMKKHPVTTAKPEATTTSSTPADPEVTIEPRTTRTSVDGEVTADASTSFGGDDDDAAAGDDSAAPSTTTAATDTSTVTAGSDGTGSDLDLRPTTTVTDTRTEASAVPTAENDTSTEKDSAAATTATAAVEATVSQRPTAAVTESDGETLNTEATSTKKDATAKTVIPTRPPASELPTETPSNAESFSSPHILLLFSSVSVTLAASSLVNFSQFITVLWRG